MTDNERFLWGPDDVEVTSPQQCSICIHRHEDGGYPTCDAFPGGIPIAILTNRFDHTKRYPGDQGIRFEPKSK